MSADTIPSKPALPPLNSPENIQERGMMDSVGRNVIKFVLWGLFSPFSRLRIAARNTMVRDEVQNPSRYGLFVTTLIPVESGSVAVQTISKRGHSPLHQQKV